MYLSITGSHPDLSFAELESLFGKAKVQPLGTKAALVDSPTMPDMRRLGGSQKIGLVINELHGSWDTVAKKLPAIIKAQTATAEGKITFGISVYGAVSAKSVLKCSLETKKILKSGGHSIRVIPNKSPALSTAQVYHNNLGTGGFEFMVVLDVNKAIIAKTLAVQDIDAYAQRDYERPMRDARVGMLPPKLAQIMINLGVGKDTNSYHQQPTVYDPFCGTGVVLQEALLMGYAARGSDIDERMVEYTNKNLEWLNKANGKLPQWNAAVADARHVKLPAAQVSVVSETYLGPPLNRDPSSVELDRMRKNVDSLVYKTLQNLANQTTAGSTHCIAVPVWKIANSTYSLPLIDQISKLGYNLRTFTSINGNQLVYRRPDSIVGRQLLVLEKS